MSVSQLLGLDNSTPVKKFVDCDINAWMETQKKGSRLRQNQKFKLVLPKREVKSQVLSSFRISKGQKAKQADLSFRQLQPQKLPVVQQKVHANQMRCVPLKQSNMNYLLKSAKEQNLNKNNYYIRIPVRNSFKFKQSNFKSHLSTKQPDFNDKIFRNYQYLSKGQQIREVRVNHFL